MDIFNWREYDKSLKIAQAKKWAKIAQRRMNNLKKDNVYTYAVKQSEEYFKRAGLKKFTTKIDNFSESQLNGYLQELENFLGFETSTKRGTKKVFNNLMNNLSNNGVDISKINKEDFFQFLYSNQFQQLRKTIDSNVLIEDYKNAQEMGFTSNEIMKQYEQHLLNGLTLDEIQDLRDSKVLIK